MFLYTVYSNYVQQVGLSMAPPTVSRCTLFVANWLSEKDYSGELMSTWAEKSKSSEDKVYCKICLETISVKSRGVTRMKEHGNTEKHKRNAAEIRQSRPLKDFFVQKTPAVDISDDVCDSEIRWCLLTAEHDLSYRFSDSACDTLKKMFPDSKIAEKMQCKRMKTM